MGCPQHRAAGKHPKELFCPCAAHRTLDIDRHGDADGCDTFTGRSPRWAWMAATHNHGAVGCRAAEAPKGAHKAAAGHSNLGTPTGMRKRDVPMDCPSPGHQVTSPGEGRSTHRGLQEAAFQNDRCNSLWREIPLCI